MTDREKASVQVAIAKSALRAIDESMRSLRLQRRAAQALVEQRLMEHTQALLAEKDTPA